MMRVELVTSEIEGETGLDVVINDHGATVQDLLDAMQPPADDPAVFKPYHRLRYARCEGCVNNCCKYNDINVDLVAARALAVHLGLELKRFASSYLKLNDDIPYPEFLRRPCPFLKNNRCTVYPQRALICRLYLCTPMTDRLEKLRCAVLLAGEAALRSELVELGIAPAHWRDETLRAELKARYQRDELSREDWQRQKEELHLLTQHNPFGTGAGYDQVLLRNCCTDELWEELIGPSAISQQPSE